MPNSSLTTPEPINLLTWPCSGASHNFHILLFVIYVVLSSRHYDTLLCGTITRHLILCDSLYFLKLYIYIFIYFLLLLDLRYMQD